MFRKIALLYCCLLLVCLLHAQDNKKPVSIIFDTDMGPDYDDVGAIAILHHFANKGQANILATMASTRYEGVAAVLSVLNTYFKRPDLPIGVPKGNAINQRDFQHWSDTLIARYPHAIKKNDDAPDAIALYRKILAQQPDNSVTIVTVGFFTNLSNLLQSAPDEYSKLDGKALVSKKVNRLVSMAGRFPMGSEFNVNQDAPASQYVFQHWPTTIVMSGFEIGVKIKSGLPLIHDVKIKNSPVKDVFRIAIPRSAQDSAGRCSWDETAVLIAVAGTDPYYKMVPGTMVVAADGSNTWNEKSGNHYYIVESRPSAEVEVLINKLMVDSQH